MKLLWLQCALIMTFCSFTAKTESIWGYSINEQIGNHYLIFSNYMYKDAYATVSVTCEDGPDTLVDISWIMEEVDCMEQMYTIPNQTANTILTMVPWLDMKRNALKTIESLEEQFSAEPDPNVQYDHKRVQISQKQTKMCGGLRRITLQDESDSDYYEVYIPKDGKVAENSTYTTPVKILEKPDKGKRRGKAAKDQVVQAWQDGMYHLLVSVNSPVRNTSFSASVVVQMRGDYGYLSAIVWPEYPYSGIMSFIYLTLGSGWIIMWARAHQHSAKIHLIIGTAAAAGAAANTLQFLDATSVNASGHGVLGMKWFSRSLQAGQDSLTQLLLMVVSTGYGITRPELSKPLLHSAVALTVCNLGLEIGSYVVLDEQLRLKYDHPNITLTVMVPYIMCLVITGGWIMVMAVFTLNHLCHRQHSRKIVIFSIFMSTCVLAFIGSLAMAFLSYGWFTSCRQNWKLEWFFQSFGKMQLLLLLVVMMWLWRPADQAQSYAFNPLSTDDDGIMAEIEDDEDDEDEEEEVNQNNVKIEKIEMSDLTKMTTTV